MKETTQTTETAIDANTKLLPVTTFPKPYADVFQLVEHVEGRCIPDLDYVKDNTFYCRGYMSDGENMSIVCRETTDKNFVVSSSTKVRVIAQM